MLGFTVSGDVQALAELRNRQEYLYEALRRRIDFYSLKLQQHIQRDKLSGQVLHQRSGKLKRSVEVIPATINPSTGSVSGGVQAAGGPAYYGRFHETGTTRAYTIVPVTKQALRFFVDGRAIFARRVEHPPIEQRSYLLSAQTDMEPEILEGLESTVLSVLSARS